MFNSLYDILFKGGVILAFVTGKGVMLLNPSEKGLKYSLELKTNCALTNRGKRKKDKYGKNIKLTKAQRSYRAGYLDHQKDSNRAYKSKHPNYRRRTRNRWG